MDAVRYRTAVPRQVAADESEIPNTVTGAEPVLAQRTPGPMESLVIVLVRLATIGVVAAIWRLADDLEVLRGFPFNSGVLSHWQVWFAVAVLLSTTALTLTRRMQLAQSTQAERGRHAQPA